MICGLATDYCVVETVLDARMLGYPVEVLHRRRAGGGAASPATAPRALARMRDAGAELV